MRHMRHLMGRIVMVSVVGILGGLHEVAMAQPAPPPAPVFRAVPPGMEDVARAYRAPQTSKAPSSWRSGFTLHVSLGAGQFIAADGSRSEGDSSTQYGLSLGGFLTPRVAALVHLDGSSGGQERTAQGLALVAIAVDVFATERFFVGAGLGEAQTRRSYDVRSGPGVCAQVGYVVWQRRQHGIDVVGAASVGWFDAMQVTTAGVRVGYRFF